MPYILAFDQSITRCGWALYQPPKFQAIVSGSYSSEDGRRLTDKVKLFARQTNELFLKYKPDLVAHELAEEWVRRYPKKGGGREDLAGSKEIPLTVNPDTLVLHDIQGSIITHAEARDIPCIDVNVKTWRASILKNGNLDGDAAKRKAVALCHHLRIPVSNHDQAEAICIALYAATTDIFRSIERGLQNKTTAA